MTPYAIPTDSQYSGNWVRLGVGDIARSSRDLFVVFMTVHPKKPVTTECIFIVVGVSVSIFNCKEYAPC